MIQSQTPSSQLFQETPPQDLPKDSTASNNFALTGLGEISETKNDKDEESKKFEENKEESHFLEFIPKSEQDTVSFKEIKNLSKSQMKAYNMCYIPERNILLVIQKGLQRVKIYSTIDFKLVSTVSRTDLAEVHVIKYCQHLNKILVGGAQNLVEIWNPVSFKIEKRIHDEALDSSDYVQNLEYLQEIGRLCVATKTMMLVYDTDLNLMSQFVLPWRNGSWKDFSPDLFAISEDRMLMTCFSNERKFFVLINLKTQTLKEYNDFFVPYTSVIRRTGPNRFLALVNLNLRRLHVYWKLMEMKFDLETEEFVFSKNLANLPDFRRFKQIERSNYFLGKYRIGVNTGQTCLLWINEGKIEMIQPNHWSDWEKAIMMKDGFSVIEVDYKDDVSISNMKIHQGNGFDDS